MGRQKENLFLSNSRVLFLANFPMIPKGLKKALYLSRKLFQRGLFRLDKSDSSSENIVPKTFTTSSLSCSSTLCKKKNTQEMLISKVLQHCMQYMYMINLSLSDTVIIIIVFIECTANGTFFTTQESKV